MSFYKFNLGAAIRRIHTIVLPKQKHVSIPIRRKIKIEVPKIDYFSFYEDIDVSDINIDELNKKYPSKVYEQPDRDDLSSIR